MTVFHKVLKNGSIIDVAIAAIFVEAGIFAG